MRQEVTKMHWLGWVVPILALIEGGWLALNAT